MEDLTDILKKCEEKLKFWAGVWGKRTKKQSEIKVCYKNDEEIEELTDILKKCEEKLKFWAGVWGERSEETICNQGLL